MSSDDLGEAMCTLKEREKAKYINNKMKSNQFWLGLGGVRRTLRMVLIKEERSLFRFTGRVLVER